MYCVRCRLKFKIQYNESKYNLIYIIMLGSINMITIGSINKHLPKCIQFYYKQNHH